VKLVYNDIDLIQGFRQGEEDAVKQLYNLYYRPLCYFSELLLHNHEEAEDIAVDVFLKLLFKKEDFDNLSDIKSFLFTATRNACFDLLRKKKIMDKMVLDLANLSEPDDLFGEQEMIASKILQVIYAEIENLPNQCKQVFTSIFIEGKSTAEIAAEMRISPQTVLNQKSKALQTLRLKLFKEGINSSHLFFYCLFLLAGQGQS
jgi:RNA polymerase sigma-70 factor (family 1)